MLNIILYQPEIPPNTGNIIRLCANAGFTLHLIHPLGFNLDEKSLRRAGCDYHALVNIHEHQSLDECLNFIHRNNKLPHNIIQKYALTTKGKQNLYQTKFNENDCILFGPETRGLPDHILDNIPSENKIRIPMQQNSRSINLSNAVAITAFEALRQIKYSISF